MRTKFTFLSSKFFTSLLLLTLCVGITKVKAQAPFAAGQTYYVDGVGVDLVSPKDTFMNLTGAYSVGNPYTSTTGIISALNANGIDPTTLGQITIMLAPGYSGNEATNAGIVINTINYASPLRKIVMKPTLGYNFTITNTVALAANTALLRFNGTQFFTIDGTGLFGQNSITFKISTLGPQATGRVVDFISTSTTSINTVAISNLNLIGYSTVSTVTTNSGVYIGGVGLGTNSLRRNSNISITNCVIEGVQNGISARGANSTGQGNQDLGLIIRNNYIGGTNKLGGAVNAAGILLSNQSNAIVEYNKISGNLANFTGFKGIELNNIVSPLSLDSNISINGNSIYNISAISGGVCGIKVSLGTHTQALKISITNNTIAKLTSPGSAAIASMAYPIGILVENNSSNTGIDIFNNSVALSGTNLAGSTAACLVTGPLTSGGLRVFNNIFSNRMENIITNTIAYNTYAIIVAKNPTGVAPNQVVTTPFDSIDNNLYDVATTGGWANIGYTSLNNYASVTEWGSFTNYDRKSIVTRPYFENDTVLTTSNGAPTTYAILGRSMVAMDIKGTTRPAANASIGAYQFTQNTTNAYTALEGGKTYLINGTDDWPTNANSTNKTFSTYGSFVNYLNSYGTKGTGTINIVFSTGFLTDVTVPPAIGPYPGMQGTRPIKVSAASGVSVNLTVDNGKVVCNNSGIIRLYGASFFEIDGTDGMGGKAITISLPTSANSVQAKLITLAPTLLHQTSYITIRNCKLVGSSTNSMNNTYAGIYMGAPTHVSGSASALSGANINNYISDNTIEAVRNGIYWRALAGQTDQFLTIKRNVIGGTTPTGTPQPTTYIGGNASNLAGIYVKGISQSVIDSNVVRNSISNATGFRGIDLDALPLNATQGEPGSTMSVEVTRNTIYNLGANSGFAVGIRIAATEANRNILLANNLIAKIYGTGSPSVAVLNSPAGISFEQPVAGAGEINFGINVIHNTVHLSNFGTAQVNPNSFSTALYADARVTGLTVRNNLFSNKLGRTTAGTISNCYIYAFGGNQAVFTEVNANVYHVGANPNFSNNQIGIANITQILSMYELREIYGGDGSSLFGEVAFLNDSTSAFDPLYVGHFAQRFIRNNLAVVDITGAGRSVSTVTAGALEVVDDYSPLMGGTTYHVNGTLAPPSKTSPLVGSFNTINNLFRFINSHGVDDGINPPKKDITILITSGYTGEGDTLITALHDYPKMGLNRVIVIKPDANANPVISSTAATTRSQYTAAGAVMRFQGAQYVTIDGSNDNGVTRNLTIQLPSTPGVAAYVNNALTRVIDIIGWSRTASNITIKNCNILGYSNVNTIFTYAGIYQGGVAFNLPTTVPTNPLREQNNDNTFENNFIGGVKYGIYLRGVNNISGGYDLRTKVLNNVIGGDVYNMSPNPTNYFGGLANAAGILVAHQANTTIEGNKIQNNIPTFNANSGIELSNLGIPATGQANTDSAITITRNIIKNIKSNSTAAYGIYTNIRWDGVKNINIFNNMISGIASTGNTPSGLGFNLNPYGIFLDGTLIPGPPAPFPAIGVNIWNNSINLGQANTLSTAGISACIAAGLNTKGGIKVTNNILQNRLSRASGSGNIYALVSASNVNAFEETDYNNYYVAGTYGTNNIGGVNASAVVTRYQTFTNWVDFTGQDTMSMTIPSPFTSDIDLLIPTNTSSPLYRAGQRLPMVNRDVLDAPRPSLSSGVATIGAHEFVGTFLDIFPPRAFDYTKAFEYCPDPLTGTPLEIRISLMDKNPVLYDTLYYKVNGGAEIPLQATTKAGTARIYTIPALPANSKIAYRIGGSDGEGNPINFVNADPTTGYNYATTTMTVSSSNFIATGFDMADVFNWKTEQISGTDGVWDTRSFGSLTNPTLAPLTGSRAAMFKGSNGSSSRLVSPCLDFTSSQRPTLRLFISQDPDNPTLRDSIQVTIGGFGSWVSLPSLYPIYRQNSSFATAGYKVYDFCLEELFGQSGFKIGIEAYSKGGGAIILDSIVIFDNFMDLPVNPATISNCYNDSINVFISNADSKFEYRLFDNYTQSFVGPYFQGNDGTLKIQGYMNNVDSAELKVLAHNLTSNCTNFMTNVVKVNFRNFKNGPFVIKGSVFDGQFNVGDFFTPDAVKVGGTARYELVPPKGTTNSSYGTDWTVSSATIYKYFYNQIANENVIVDSASSYSLVPPASGNPGYVLVNAMPSDSNKTFLMEVTIRLLPEGCDSVVARYVTMANAPIANFYAPNDTLCQNINNYFTNVSTTGAYTIPLQFDWDFGDGTKSSVASPVKKFSNPGTYRVRLIAKNNTTLIDSIATTVVVLPTPSASFTSTVSCEGKNATFTSTGTYNPSYHYRFNIGGQIADSNVVKAIIPGYDTTVRVTLFVTNTEGCTDTMSKFVNVFAQPVASFTSQDVCAGSSVQFTNNSSIKPGKDGRVNTLGSEWSFGNGDTGYSNNPLYYYPQGGQYRVVLKVISNYGCEDTVSALVSIHNKPVVDFTIDNACRSSKLTIDNKTTFTGDLGRLSYDWNFGDNTLHRKEAVPTKTYGAIGSYYVTLVVRDTLNGCLDSVRKVVQVKDRATADFTASNGCVGTPVSFSNLSIVPAGKTPTFTYLFGDNSTSNQPNTTHAYVLGGVKNVSLIVDIDGCRDTSSKSITISQPISVSFLMDSLSPNSVKFTANRVGLSRYSWNFGDGSPVVNTKSNIYTHIFDKKGWNVVTLTVQDSNGCDATSVDSVFIDRRVGVNELLALQANFNVYPNPFENSANVVFDVDQTSAVSLDVFDMIGRKVFTQNLGLQTAGSKKITINEQDFDSKSSVYLIRLTIGDKVISRQLIKK